MTRLKLAAVLPVRLRGVVKIDGRADASSRLWLRLDTTAEIVSDGHFPAGGIVRVTTDEWQDQQRLGSKLAMRVRLYPPPTRVLAGVADYGRQARAQGVLASGYVISGLRPVADGGDRSGLSGRCFQQCPAGFPCINMPLSPRR
jgi:hypothetical protein